MKTILIVDDSVSLRQVVKIALAGEGYEVIEACDGADALRKLGGMTDKRVHLIISDVNMPNLDGISFVRELKKNTQHKYTPVIMLTTESEEGKKQQGREAGARAWMLKPFQPAQILSAVSRLVMA